MNNTRFEKPNPSRDERFDPRAALVWGGFLGVLGSGLAALLMSGAEIWTLDYWGGSRSEVIRNLMLAALAFPALLLAWSRTATATRQANTAERGLEIDRFQKGAQMLESEKEPVQIAAIFALRELTRANPNEYYIPVQSLLCSVVREKTRDRKSLTKAEKHTATSKHAPRSALIKAPRYEPVQAVVTESLASFDTLRKEVPNAKELETAVHWRPDFTKANLSGMKFFCYDFSESIFDGARLVDTSLVDSKLNGAEFTRADLAEAKLFVSNFKSVSFSNTSLVRTMFDDSNLIGTSFIYCDATGASFYTSKLRQASFVNVNLTGAYLNARTVKFMSRFHDTWAWEDDPPNETQKGGMLPVELYAPGDDDKNVKFYEELVEQYVIYGKPEPEFLIKGTEPPMAASEFPIKQTGSSRSDRA